MEDQEPKSALNVMGGVKQPSPVNSNAVDAFRSKRKPLLSAQEYVDGIIHQDINILSQAITLIESTHPSHFSLAREIIGLCLPLSGKSIRIGITGVPGVGKSTFIESFGKTITGQGHKLAVLAIDPSSNRSKGSILGDKTRMEDLSSDPNAFIRPSPSSGSLGGVARKTRETIILCEAFGFDTILIETVGVGQSEIAVHSMVDFFLLLMLAGAGDELQGIKRGIMEMADLIAITKSDGSNIEKANLAQRSYLNALHLFPPSDSGWVPKVFTCSSISGSGIERIWNNIIEYRVFATDSGYFSKRRKEQAHYWMLETINESLQSNFFNNAKISKMLPELEKELMDDKISSFEAAHILLKKYFK